MIKSIGDFRSNVCGLVTKPSQSDFGTRLEVESVKIWIG